VFYAVKLFDINTVKARRNTYGGAINHSRGVLHGSYKKKITPVRCPKVNILHGENEVFQKNRNDFPKVSFTLDVI
jgi:hypothetical protein